MIEAAGHPGRGHRAGRADSGLGPQSHRLRPVRHHLRSSASSVAIADRIGACVDTTASVCQPASTMAFQNVGEATCSLGEVKNRADLVIFWGSDPVESHPRHWGRYSAMPEVCFIPKEPRSGPSSSWTSANPKSARRRGHLPPEFEPAKDFEALWILRGLVKGLDVHRSRRRRAGIIRWSRSRIWLSG